MSESKHRYTRYDVMKHEQHWDDHTQSVVGKRLKTKTFYPYQFLSQDEAETLYHLCAGLLDEVRYPVIAFVLHHFDTMLNANIGESQRKIGVPKQSQLIRGGLAWIEANCQSQFGCHLAQCDEDRKRQLVHEWMQVSPAPSSEAEPNHSETQSIHSDPVLAPSPPVPVQDFMQKILTEAVSAYYSHPTIWSEIGYGGPAYPRGYVRTELGLTDPWEAKRDDSEAKI